MCWIYACTDADCDQQFAPFNQQWAMERVHESVAALDDLLDAFAFAVHDGKFITPKARCKAVRGRQYGQSPGHGLQYTVPCGVSHAVIEVLEIVQIQK